MRDDIVVRLREHQDVAACVADAGWALRVGASGPEVAPNVFRDAANVIEAQRVEIERLRDLVDGCVAALAPMMRLGAPPEMVEFVHWQLDHSQLFDNLKNEARRG